MDDSTRLKRYVLAQEAYLTAWRTFALDQRQSDKEAAFTAAVAAEPGLLASYSGKYVEYATGYIHFKANGNGEWLNQLPPDVPPDQVVPNDLDVEGQTPLGDRLAAVAQTLHSYAQRDANFADLSGAVDRMLKAYRRPDNAEHCLAQLQEWIQTEVFGANASNDAADVIERANRVLDHLGQYAENLHRTVTADGWTVGALLAIRAMILAAARQSEDVRYQAYVFETCLQYVMVIGRGLAGDAAERLSDRMIRQGYKDAVRSAAEELVSEGNALIDDALDSEPIIYYSKLYPAAAYELAGVLIGKGAAAAPFAGPDLGMMIVTGQQPRAAEPINEDDRERWAGLSANAEERAVRIAAVLKVALRSLDDGGAFSAFHREMVKRERAEKGEGAARLMADDLIENHFLYPRTYLATLLGESEQSDD
jgi:hypothetical protein